MCSIDINDYVWSQAKNKDIKLKPYHLTRCTNYKNNLLLGRKLAYVYLVLKHKQHMWNVWQCLTLNSFEIISTVRIEWLNVRKFIFHI